jgi:hypothetical protein
VKKYIFLILLVPVLALAAESDRTITVDWNKVVARSRTSLSIQVCPEPPMRRSSPIHDQIYGALLDMKIDYARLQPWYPYPRLSVAELEPPKDGKTSWDFSQIDPIVLDFFAAAEGRPVMLSFSTLPQWMFRTEKPVTYPNDPDEITWNYGGGNELRDPSLKEVVDYYHRLASWYMKGGFHDEYGKWHESGHRFKVAYWEVLNEIDIEHELTPQQYTAIYDAVVADLRKLDPGMKFSGLALAGPSDHPEYIAYFLDRKNHQPGIPLDLLSYHFYAAPDLDEMPEVQQHTFFKMADRFLSTVRHIEVLRQHLSPTTQTYINELGSFTPDTLSKDAVIPPSYWVLSGSMFAYLYPQLVQVGVDIIAAAELIDYPGQFAGATLVDWDTGRPNARYWVVKLLRDNFGSGDRLVDTRHPEQVLLAQAFITPKGERKILLVNKRNREITVSIPDGAGSKIDFVDQTTGFNPPASLELKEASVTLRPQAVAVVTVAK